MMFWCSKRLSGLVRIRILEKWVTRLKSSICVGIVTLLSTEHHTELMKCV